MPVTVERLVRVCIFGFT